MNINLNRTARIVGALYLISNATFLIGATVFLEPFLTAQDTLVQIGANGSQIALGALLEIINGVAYIGIAALMFPILKQRFESMALGYFAFRIIEFVTQIAASIVPFLLVALSGAMVGAGAPISQAIGELLLATRYWTYEILYFVFCLSALMFYYMLYQTKLVPRFLSVWGLIAAALVLFNTLFELFSIDLGTAVAMVTGLPMLLNELFLGVWLIVKGFNPAAEIMDSAGVPAKEAQLRVS
jgi:hypothetical protein